MYRSHVLFDNVILVKCFVGKHRPEGFVLYSMCLVFCLFKCSNNLHLWTAFSPFCTLCAKNTRVRACARLYTTTIPEFLTHTSLPADALHQSKVHNIIHITVTHKQITMATSCPGKVGKGTVCLNILDAGFFSKVLQVILLCIKNF